MKCSKSNTKRKQLICPECGAYHGEGDMAIINSEGLACCCFCFERFCFEKDEKNLIPITFKK